MKMDMLGLAEAMSDVQASYEELDQQLRQTEDVVQVMMGVESLYNDVLSLGFCDEVKHELQNCEALQELTKLSVDKIVKYQSMEGVGEAVKEGAKKFWEAIKALFQKFAEFFDKVFNTFNFKCRELMLHLNAIDFEKEVNTMTKEKYAKLLSAGYDVKKFMDQAFQRVGNKIRFTRGVEVHMARIASAHPGVLIRDNYSGMELDENASTFDTATLKDAGYSVGDVRNFVTAFQTKTKNYSQLGAFFVTIAKEYESGVADRMDNSSYADRHAIRTSIRAQGFLYHLLAKIQSVTCKQIVAFYKCIGSAISVNPDYKSPAQVGYQPA